MLKCYECAENGANVEGVAVCITCGIGLCMEHAKRVDLPIWEGGYPMPVKILEKGLPRIMCKYCSEIIIPEACV